MGAQARPAADYTTPTQARLHGTQLLTRITQLGNLILGIHSRLADSLNQLLQFSLFNATLRPCASLACGAVAGNRLLALRTPRGLCVSPRYSRYNSCLPEFTGYPIGHRHSTFSLVFTIRGAVLSFFNSYSFLMYHQIRRLVALGTFRTGHVISGNAGMPHVAQAR